MQGKDTVMWRVSAMVKNLVINNSMQGFAEQEEFFFKISQFRGTPKGKEVLFLQNPHFLQKAKISRNTSPELKLLSLASRGYLAEPMFSTEGQNLAEPLADRKLFSATKHGNPAERRIFARMHNLTKPPSKRKSVFIANPVILMKHIFCEKSEFAQDPGFSYKLQILRNRSHFSRKILN